MKEQERCKVATEREIKSIHLKNKENQDLIKKGVIVVELAAPSSPSGFVS
jgi:hypothetical protein